MKTERFRRTRWSVVAVAAAAVLGASALTTPPAFAAGTVSGQVLDIGIGVQYVDVDIYKYDATARAFSVYTDGGTAADGTWSVSGLPDGTFSLFYDVSDSAAAFSANQGSRGELLTSELQADFTITGGVTSTPSIVRTLLRNAGVVQLTLTTESGTVLTGDATHGSGYAGVTRRYSDSDGLNTSNYSTSEYHADFDGTLAITHLPAGIYYYGITYGQDIAGTNYGSHYFDPITVTAATTTNFGQVKIVDDANPSVSYPYPKIEGAAKVGSLLTVTAAPTPASLTYQWYSGGDPIPGASAQTYAPTARQLGERISVRIIARQAAHIDDYWDADDTKPVAIGDPDAATVAITGSARFGATLKASVTTPLAGTIGYQWYRNGAVIAGADGSSFAVTKSDLGTSLFVSVKSTAQGHSDAVIPSAAVVIAKESVSLKATTDKTIKTKTTPKVKITIKSSKSGIGATGKVRVYYTKTKYKSVTVKSGKSATVKLPKLKKGTTTLKVVYVGTTYYAAKTTSIKVKVSK